MLVTGCNGRHFHYYCIRFQQSAFNYNVLVFQEAIDGLGMVHTYNVLMCLVFCN